LSIIQSAEITDASTPNKLIISTLENSKHYFLALPKFNAIISINGLIFAKNISSFLVGVSAAIADALAITAVMMLIMSINVLIVLFPVLFKFK
tara:strand:+ start:1252 stop:1530 length:279 start_codon:yes stop_codon:yes gene_type:complete